MSNRLFMVEVIIENKPEARDPEGDTILNSLILKGGYKQVRSVRAAKYLRLTVEADSGAKAENLVKKMCDELRIYNPAAHICKVRLESSN